MADIIRMPISYLERKKNEMGIGYVPCQISTRYFKVESIELVGDKNFIMLDVMTENEEHEHKKICQMVISVEDLNTAINEVANKNDK